MSAISELVSKYGTSLEETRKLLGKIRPEISKLREERNLLLSQPVYLTPSEAKEEYGITLEENYKLKLTPDNGKYTASLLTPGGWEMLQGPGVPSRSGIIYPHESFISPEGKKFTREEFEAQFTTPEPEEEWYKGGKIPAYEFPGIETQFETPDYAKLQQVFGKVYPERDIEEIAAFADEQPEEFLATIRDVGQTEDTEYLLKAMFRGITDEQMAGFFEGLGEKEEFPTAEERQAILFEDLGYNPAPPVQSYEERQERSKAFQAYRKAGGKLFADQWELYGMPVSPAEELPMLSPQEHQAVIDREVEKSTNLLKLLGEGLTLLPKQVAASVLQAVQGQGGASVVDRNWADDLISDANDDIQEFTVKLEANYGTANLPINPVDLATLPQNMAFSITSMGAGIGIGVPIALAPVPGARIAAWLTGSAASGAVAYNMTSYQIMQQYLEAKNEEMIAATGRGLTAEEEEALKEGFETQARNYGLWEAIPEAVSNLLFGKILTAPLVKVAGKNIATKIIVKLVELYGEELLTETITQKGQSNIEVEAGLRDGKINWVEAFKEVAPQTFLLTTIMGGTGQIGITSVNKIKESLHKEIGGTPIHDVIKENITEDVFSGIEAESGKVEGITPEQIKTITEKTDQLMIELPESKDIIADAFAPNWLKDVLQHLAKIPVVGTAIEKGIMTTLGPRELVRLDSKAVEDIVAKAAILRLEIQSMGTNARAANVWGLRSISSNPVKLFGFDENAISKTIPRVSDKATGTLEDIFIHPELYKLTEKQLAYVNKVHEVNMEIYRLLNKEGVAPRALSEDWWIHRVVVGKYNADGELAAIRGRPGMKGKTLGAKRAYEMHRKAPTMAEGIAWGIKYGRNPEDYVGTYVEEAFNKIADARFAAEVAEFGEKPSEILAERYPDIVKKATLTTKQLADIKKLDAILGRAIRGERLPEQTLRAMERRFPDWGRKLRGAVQESIDSERKLGEYISYLKRQQTELQNLLAKKQTKEAVAQAKTIEAVPEEHKLVEAFKVMDYEDRVAYRSVMEEQMADIEQMSYEYTAQIEALQESLAYDPVARWRGKMPVEPKRFTKKELAAGAVRKRKFKPYKEIKLTDFLVRGEWPETITIKQAKALLGGEISLLPNVLDKTGKRVKWEYILDQLVGTDEFRHMGETEFIHHVEQVKADFNKLADFQSLENLASARIEDIQKILGVLDSVDVAHGPVSEITPEVTPPAAVEPAVIPEGVRPPLYIADLEGMMPKNAKRVKAVTLADGGELVLMSSKGDIYGLVNNQEVGFVTKLSATETDLSVAVEYRNRGIGTELLRQFKLENPGYPTGGLTEGGRRVEEKLAEPAEVTPPAGRWISGAAEEVQSLVKVSLGHKAFGLKPEVLKRGDEAQARQVIEKNITEDRLASVTAYVKPDDTVAYVPIPSAEDAGNIMPTVYAKVLSERIGGNVRADIASLVAKVGQRCLMMNGWEKLVTKRHFEATGGQLEAGARVFIVDDVFTDGGTMRDMASALEDAGYKVEGFLTIGSSRKQTQKGNRIKPFKETLAKLEATFNKDEIAEIETSLGYNVNEFTEGEIRILLTAKDMSQARDNIRKAKAKYGLTEEVIPKATEGMPEAGLQKGMFGYNKPVFPKGKGKIIQISMDDYGKLSKAWKDAGLPGGPDNVGIKPKVEGIKGLEAETTYVRSDTSMPKIKTPTQRIAELKALKVEAKLLMEQRKAAYWKAKGERTAAMEKIRQPGVEQGYIMQPMFGGKIYDTEFIDSVNKFFGHKQGIGALRFTSDFAGILRITKAAMDFSVMAIQGMPGFGVAHSYLLTNPKIGTKLMGSWFKAFTYQVGAFFNPDVISGYMSKNKSSIMQRIAAGGSSQSVDYFEALGAEQGVGGIMAKAFQKDPLRLFPRAETSFFTGGEMIRDEFWKILRPLALEKGEEFELARALDRMTGIIDSKAMAVPLTERQVESSFVWFAPRYTRACSSLVAHTFRGGFTGAQARRAMSGMIAAGAIYYSAVTFALALMRGKSEDDAMDEVEEGFGIFTDPITGEVEWKPSARFMTLKIGNYYFGLGGFWYGLVRLTGNILACVNEVGTRERIDFLKITKYGGMNRDNPFLAWWYSRSSPLTGTIRDLVTGRNFLGTPIETPWEYAWYTANRFTPIWIEQGVLPYFEDKLAKWLPNVASQNEMPEDEARILTPVAEIFGLRTFPQNNWSRFYDMADEIIGRLPVDFLEEHYTPEELKKIMEAQAQGKLTWAQLNKTARMALLSMYPELDDFYKEAQGASLLNDSDAWKQWNERIEEERRIRNKRIDNATERFLGGEIDAREWDRLCDEAEKLYGKAYEDIEKNPAYAEVRDYFEKQEAKGDKYDWADDVALAEYESQVMFASDLYDETSQTYDWDERDRRVADFIDKWGMDVYERVLWYRREKKKDSGLNDIRVRHAKDLELLGRDYWNLPYKAIYTMDDKDKAEGSIPVEYLGLWEEYQRLEGKARDEFLQANPSLNKDWRAEWRAAHPEDDARLKLWGYGGDLQSKEAYDILRGWTKEFKLSSESQVLMKLPPENIVAPFFDYKDVQRVSGGNSAEARLFRLEHEAFNEWGKEAYGWKDVDDNINVLKLSAKWRETDDKYDALETTEEREAFLEANSEYADDRRRKDAYGYEFPDNLIETYVEYYKIDLKGYADDWFLMEHPEFYNKMLELEIWTKEKDFSKVPTKEVYALYQTYQGLPTGQPRVDFRARYPKLDDWLVLAFGYKPISDRGKEEAAQTPWDKAAEAQTIKNWLDSL